MARAKLREIAEQSDPKQALLDSLGDAINHVHPLRYEAIVATYVRPEKTAGGIYLSDRTLVEDRFQGKVGLLVKFGPLAFSAEHWGDRAPQLHEEMFVLDPRGDGTAVRRMDDIGIRGIVDNPALIW